MLLQPACNSHVHHVTLEDVAQFTPEKVNHIYRGGIRQGASRTDTHAQQMVDKIPASQRAGVDGQSAAARTKEYLSNPHSARNGSLKIFTTRQSWFQRFQKKLMIMNPISVSLLTILK